MKTIRWVRRGCALLGIGVVGGALVVTTRHALQTPQPLASELPGEARIDRDHGGELYYTVAGPDQASPIVLLHDFYPGASSYEYSSVFTRLTHTQRVYAPDWLGFGMSEHPALAYTGEFYANMLAGYLRDVVERPATVVASGLAANIAARAASDAPTLFDRLVLISPHIAAGAHLDPTVTQTLVRLAQRASLGLLPHALASSRPMLRLAAMRRGVGAATEDALDHQWAAAHQFSAQYAALAALTGELDLPIQHLLPLLEPPIFLVAGEDDRRQTRDELEELAILNPYADLDIIPGSGAAICQDQPARFVTAVTLWMQREIPRHVSSDTLRIGASAVAVAQNTLAPNATSTRPASNGISALRVAPPLDEASALPDVRHAAPTAKQATVRKAASTSQSRAGAKGATGQPRPEPTPEPAPAPGSGPRRATRPPKPPAQTPSTQQPEGRSGSKNRPRRTGRRSGGAPEAEV